VAEGKLSPEDAADLIDAFYGSERVDEPYEPAGEATPPPPPPPPGSAAAHDKDPFKALVESIEKLTKEGLESVNWTEVSKHARTSARRGFEAFRTGVEEISKGKVNFGWLFTSETKQVSLPLSLAAGKTLKIENLCGDVKVTGGFGTGSVTADARFRGQTAEDARAKSDAYTLIIEESDHSVVIRQPDVSGLEVDLTVEMPGTGPVEVRTESGDVRLSSTGGACRVSGRSGNISVRGAEGVTELSTESGNIVIEDSVTPSLTIDSKSGNITGARVKGNVNARAASGNIVLEAAAGKSIAVEAVSGNLKLDLVEPVTGYVNARTVSGSVWLAVPLASECRVSLSTLRGTVDCRIDLTDCLKQDQRITGRLGDGSGTLDVSAVTGNVELVPR
jgi:DUF4097 and DUF4098 domain-containing protein YvlB